MRLAPTKGVEMCRVSPTKTRGTDLEWCAQVVQEYPGTRSTCWSTSFSPKHSLQSHHLTTSREAVRFQRCCKLPFADLTNSSSESPLSLLFLSSFLPCSIVLLLVLPCSVQFLRPLPLLLFSFSPGTLNFILASRVSKHLFRKESRFLHNKVHPQLGFIAFLRVILQWFDFISTWFAVFFAYVNYTMFQCVFYAFCVLLLVLLCFFKAQLVL